MDDVKATDRSHTTDPAKWVDLHGDALYRFALLRLRDQEQAEDAVQETLTAALAARGQFSARSSERTWLVGILKRKVIDRLRITIRERPDPDTDEAEVNLEPFFTSNGHWANGPQPWGGDPGVLLENREFWAAFRQCLEGLSPRLAEAFLLREMDRMNGEEICKVLEVSPTNLWARLHRARLGLRQCLERHWFAAHG